MKFPKFAIHYSNRHTMWKKTQTFYIIASTLLTTAMFFCSFATIIGPDGYELKIMYYEKLPYLTMLIMLLTAGICSLFTFRQGFLQARVCTLTALMLIGFQIWLGIDFIRFRHDMVFSVTMLFPLAAAILDALAARSALVDAMAIQAAGKILKKNRKR